MTFGVWLFLAANILLLLIILKAQLLEWQLPRTQGSDFNNDRRFVLLKRTFTITLSGILLFTAFGLQTTRAQTTGSTQLSEKARAKIQKLGVGRDARVEIRLRDDTSLKGYLSASGEDSFTVTDSKTGAARTVAYTDVTQVKKPGGGLSTRTWVIIGAAATAALIIGVTVIKPVVCDGGAGC